MNEEQKFKALKELKGQYSDCTRCGLCKDRASVVFGRGNPDARILVIGETPGPDEDAYGVPFYGAAGSYFASIMAKSWPIEDLGFAEIKKIRNDSDFIETASEYLDEHCFYTNAVMCKPKRDVKPKKSQIDACRDRLIQIIYTVDPDIILACGSLAASAVVGKLIKMKSYLGKLTDVSIPSPVSEDPIRYGMQVVYSPGYLLVKGDQALVARKQGDSYKTIQHCAGALAALDTMHMHQRSKHFWEK